MAAMTDTKHTPTPGNMRASAVKSRGEYKAVIIHTINATRERREILGKRERPLIWRGREPLPGGPTHFVRGKTYATRADAVAVAERSIEKRLARRAALAKAEGGAV